MITLADIIFSETCCGGHKLMAEHIRDDGIGFLIERDGEETLYEVKKYSADGVTKLETKTDLTEAAMLLFINT